MKGQDFWGNINEKITVRLLYVLSTEEICDEKKAQKVKYALQVILNESEKFILLLFLFFATHHLEQFLVAFFSLCSLRIYIGGMHCKTVFGCFSFSFFSFGFILLMAHTVCMVLVARYIVYLSILFWIWYSAPISSPERPIYTKEQCLIFKGKALTVLVMLCLIGQAVSNQVENLILWAIAYQSLEAGFVTINKKIQERMRKK